MKTVTLSLIALFAIALTGQAQTPAGRYAQINGAIGTLGVPYDSTMLAVPTSDTLVVAGDVVVQNMHCSSSVSTLLTITDNQTGTNTCGGTGPCPYFPAVPIAPAASQGLAIAENLSAIGMRFKNGIRFHAAATGVKCQFTGVK